MKQTGISISIASMVFLIACGSSGTKEAREYNDFLASCIDSAMLELEFTYSYFYVQPRDARGEYDHCRQVVQSQLQRIRERPAFNGHDALKQAAIDWLRYYEEILGGQYATVLEMVEKHDTLIGEDRELAKKLLDSTYEKEEMLEENFRIAQIKMANKYNFTITKDVVTGKQR